jgi:hypothetical protein
VLNVPETGLLQHVQCINCMLNGQCELSYLRCVFSSASRKVRSVFWRWCQVTVVSGLLLWIKVYMEIHSPAPCCGNIASVAFHTVESEASC